VRPRRSKCGRALGCGTYSDNRDSRSRNAAIARVMWSKLEENATPTARPSADTNNTDLTSRTYTSRVTQPERDLVQLRGALFGETRRVCGFPHPSGRTFRGLGQRELQRSKRLPPHSEALLSAARMNAFKPSLITSASRPSAADD